MNNYRWPQRIVHTKNVSKRLMSLIRLIFYGREPFPTVSYAREAHRIAV